MVPADLSVSKQRSERRISVRLPLKVSGRDARGVTFEEETSSENLCRNGAAFVTRFDVAIGSDLEIRIPPSRHTSRRMEEKDFATRLVSCCAVPPLRCCQAPERRGLARRHRAARLRALKP